MNSSYLLAAASLDDASVVACPASSVDSDAHGQSEIQAEQVTTPYQNYEFLDRSNTTSTTIVDRVPSAYFMVNTYMAEE